MPGQGEVRRLVALSRCPFADRTGPTALAPTTSAPERHLNRISRRRVRTVSGASPRRQHRPTPGANARRTVPAVPPNIPAAKRAGLPVDLDRLAAEGDGWLTPEERYALEDLRRLHAAPGPRVHGPRSASPAACCPTAQAAGLARPGPRATARTGCTSPPGRTSSCTGSQDRDVAERARRRSTGSACRPARRAGTRCATSCAREDAGVGLDEPFDCLPDARAVTDAIVARSAELNCVLPSRVNIAFGGSPRCRHDALVNDGGFVSVVRDGVAGLRGCGPAAASARRRRLAVAAGRRSCPAPTCSPRPRPSSTCSSTHGDFEEPAKGRMKFVVERLGADAFRAAWDEAFAAAPRADRTPGRRRSSCWPSADRGRVLAEAPPGGLVGRRPAAAPPGRARSPSTCRWATPAHRARAAATSPTATPTATSRSPATRTSPCATCPGGRRRRSGTPSPSAASFLLGEGRTRQSGPAPVRRSARSGITDCARGRHARSLDQPGAAPQLGAAGPRVAAARTRAPSTRSATSAWPARRSGVAARPATATRSTSAPTSTGTSRFGEVVGRVPPRTSPPPSTPSSAPGRRCATTARRSGAPSPALGLDAFAAQVAAVLDDRWADRPRARARRRHPSPRP